MLCRRNQGIKVCWGNEKLAGADLGTCLDIVGASWVHLGLGGSGFRAVPGPSWGEFGNALV